MEQITVSLVQLAWSGTIDSMKDQYRDLISQASAQGATLVCLPEFSLLPYFPGTRDEAGFQYAEPVVDGVSGQFFAEMAAAHDVTLIGSLFERDGDNYYDTAVIYGPDGALVGATRKVHIPSGEGYHETDFFGGGAEYPVWDTGAVNVAAPTCYDQWFPELARIYSMNGAEFIFYPTAIGSEPTDPDMDSAEMWQTMMRAHAIANGVFVGAANRVGHENAVTFYGSSFICAPTGEVLAQAGRDSTEVITATLEPDVMARWRGLFPLMQQRKPHAYIRLTEGADGDLPERFEAIRNVNE
ncbi:MAG: nitrilase-related carbon-nitrogen hydrolase [Chloroflexota bacterium]